MKYLRKIFENTTQDELQDLCDSYFPYLYDEGFEIRISTGRFNITVMNTQKHPESGHLIVTLGMPGPSSRFVPFSWDQVKDYYIPFLQILVRRYELILDPVQSSTNGYVGFNTEMGMKYLSLDQVINDKVERVLGCRIWNIHIRIVDKI